MMRLSFEKKVFLVIFYSHFLLITCFDITPISFRKSKYVRDISLHFHDNQSNENLEIASPPRYKKHSNRKQRKRYRKEAIRVQQRHERNTSSYISTFASNSSKKSSPPMVNTSRNQDHVSYLRQLDGHPALLLNADYQPMSHIPLSLWSWQETIKSVFSGKVIVVDVYPDVYVRAANIKMPLPSVIALTEYAPHARGQLPAFTRKNVFIRDCFRCQYCGKHFRTHELTLDHVKPRCLGGRLTWENTVACCSKCNGKKGSLQVHELKKVGMELISQPRAPTSLELAQKAGNMLMPHKVHSTWEPYLPFIQKMNEPKMEDNGEIAISLE